jgi:predicted aspartyl protease
VESVEGFVNQGELDISLLGMSFLNRLSGYEVKNGLLTLYP